MMMLEEIRSEVLQECGEQANVLTAGFYEDHVRLVVDYAGMLAARLGADREIVALAALLHDISVVRDFSTLPHHAASSAEIARSLLLGRGYPIERVAAVAAAILSHSRPLAPGEGTPEEVCLSHADAMAQIAAPAYWLYFSFRVLKLGYEDGKRWYVNRLQQNWEALIPEARELVRPRYEQATAVLAAAHL